MAQESPRREITEESAGNNTAGRDSSGGVAFKLNAQAPEFVPRSHSQVNPISGYFYPYFNYVGGGGGTAVDPQPSDWIFVGDTHDATTFFVSNPSVPFPYHPSSSSSLPRNSLSDDLCHKIVKQAEYQFSDMSILANETMSKHINRDLEGYVPISYIASTKKMRALTSNHHLVSMVLRSSLNLVVSGDGKKVRRKHPFTDRDKEDLQSRTVVAENLPEDHSYQNLEKLFGAVGLVKGIRICNPQESNSRPKGEILMSNKVHALVEYEHTDIAEKAVEKLNDERDWRKGLRVRLLLRCSPKSVLKSRKSDFDGIMDDDDIPVYDSAEDTMQLTNATDSNGEDSPSGLKRGWGKGRGKSRGRATSTASPKMSQSGVGNHFEASPKMANKGPRMPDGTRGFTMGRGKPFTSQHAD